MSDVNLRLTLREFHLVFVAPDGTEYPVIGRCECGNVGAELLVGRAQTLADHLGLALNCGIVEVQNGAAHQS